MTRLSPRAGGSSQERPRPAGKEPVAYRATTMLVHFRETPYGLAMSLVETRRENGKVRHEHVCKSLRLWLRGPDIPGTAHPQFNCPRRPSVPPPL
jgi:hypothetical protein